MENHELLPTFPSYFQPPTKESQAYSIFDVPNAVHGTTYGSSRPSLGSFSNTSSLFPNLSMFVNEPKLVANLQQVTNWLKFQQASPPNLVSNQVANTSKANDLVPPLVNVELSKTATIGGGLEVNAVIGPDVGEGVQLSRMPSLDMDLIWDALLVSDA
nr:ethylene-responsive transcription factor ERF062-like [Tanacetum cinerariifolium]